MTTEIKVFKLINNEEVVAELDNQKTQSTDYYHLINPVQLSLMRGVDGQPQMGFMPFPLHGPREQPSVKMHKEFSMEKRHVLYSYEPDPEIADEYKKIFNGFILPKSQIITG